MGIGFNVHTAAVCYLLFYAHQIALHVVNAAEREMNDMIKLNWKYVS